MAYIDVAVMPVSNDKLDVYKKRVKAFGKAWIKHGALSYTEAAAADVPDGKLTDFKRAVKLKQGETVVVAKDAHAVATVSAAKKAGMVGRPGELSVQMQYLTAGGNHIRLRGTKGREGDSRTGATVALTVLFGPIGLIKHGKNVEIPAGTPLTAYVDQDIWVVAGK